MNWQDECYLLSKRKFRENANIINVFTNNYGKMSGIVYGGNSRKIRNYLQISNKIIVEYIAKNENKIGYFKTELVDPNAPRYFNDKKRTAALLSMTSLLNSLLPEAQPYKEIYLSLRILINNLTLSNWAYLYLFWELDLIKKLGFDQNLNQFFNNSTENNGVVKAEVDNIKYKIPNFLIKNQVPEQHSDEDLKSGFIFTRTVMINKFFLANNLIFPKPRIILENYFNK